jgi:arabinogalactan oligomer/maltooligosaccharide transport system permease protein
MQKNYTEIKWHVVLLFFLVFALLPILWVLKMAFQESQNFDLTLSLIPHQPSTIHFQEILGSALFWQQIFNSLICALLTTLIGLFFSCTAAYAISRMKFWGRNATLTAFLLTQSFPGTLMMIPLYLIMDILGLLDHLLGLILVYSASAVPFCVWNLKGYFDTLPREIEESALLDGATPFQLFWKIILPLSRPALSVTALFSFMTAWNEYILAATFMSKAEYYTYPVSLQEYVGEYSTQWGSFSAGAILVSFPVAILFFILQKHLIGGLTSGGVKG